MNRARALLVLIACVAAASVPAAGQASLTGHVAVTKVLTKKRITLPSYQLRGAAIAAAEPASPLSASGADELARVVVYLEGPGLIRGAPAAVTLTQKNRRFDPEIVVIPAGSTVSFPNADPIYHNVFSLSKVMQFDLGYYPTGQTRLVKFERTGVVQVYCHLHTDMSAAILVVPTTSWTRPASDGSFSLPGIPAGVYTLVAWHRSAGFFRKQITVRGSQPETVDLIIPVRVSEEAEAPAGGSGQ
jgi:plastocyanin